jgi:hypothetical protein
MLLLCGVPKGRIQTHTHNIEHLLLFHCYKSYTNAPQSDVLRTLPVLRVADSVSATMSLR